MKKNYGIFLSAFFLLIVLMTNIIVVKADEAATDIPLWDSHIVNIVDTSTSNCILTSGEGIVDTFLAESGTKCVITGIKQTGTGESYMVVAQADNGSNIGVVPFGAVTAANSDNIAKVVEPEEIVKLIYSSSTTNVFKEEMMSLLDKPAGATKFILKAGSSDNALYIYGGYDTGIMSTLKITFDDSVNGGKYTYTLEGKEKDNDAVNSEFSLASVFLRYLHYYLMEASPNYDSAISIWDNGDKYSLIKNEFVKKYGETKFYIDSDGPVYFGIYMDLLASTNINNDIVDLYAAATKSPSDKKDEEEKKEENKKDEEENPDTGAFVNTFAIVALVCVGTVLLVGNRRKLFKI